VVSVRKENFQDAEKFQFTVTPAKAGVQKILKRMGSSFRRNDDLKQKRAFFSKLIKTVAIKIKTY
jgi:hypothetical protein